MIQILEEVTYFLAGPRKGPVKKEETARVKLDKKE